MLSTLRIAGKGPVQRAQRMVPVLLRFQATTAAAAPAAAASTLPVPNFNTVKFVKEDVEKVMAELPPYTFYEMKESEPNPYKGTTLDRSILLDPPAPVLVPPKAEFSKLENGMKIASVDKQGLTARLGLFVHAGSRWETPANFGAAHFVSLMGFTSTAHLSHLRTVKVLESLGADKLSTVKAGREETVYQVEIQREYVPYAVPIMIGNILFPRLLPWEIKAAYKKVDVARKELEGNADAMVSELLHKAAYCNNTLGLSTVATERSLAYFKADTIREFMLDHFAPERMTLVGINVSHAELTKWAMRSFADYNAIPLKKRAETKAVYTGGDVRLDGKSPFCHLAIGFESVPWGAAELAPVALLQTILGSGSAVSDTIGSGVTSRLATQVVQQSPWVESAAAFNTSYGDSGLFGVYTVVNPDKAGETVTAIAKTLKGLSDIKGDELKKAKAMLKGKLLRQADNDVELMQDMGSQLTLTGRYASPSDFAKIIDGVTEAQVSAAATKILSSKLSVAAFGDTHTVPHYSAIEAALK